MIYTYFIIVISAKTWVKISTTIFFFSRLFFYFFFFSFLFLFNLQRSLIYIERYFQLRMCTRTILYVSDPKYDPKSLYIGTQTYIHTFIYV